MIDRVLLKHHYEFKYRDGKLRVMVQRNNTFKAYDYITPSSLTRLIKTLSACPHISVDYWVWRT